MKPFRRRRIPRRTYTKQIGFTEEPPMFLQRKRAGLPRYEDRLLALLITQPDGSVEVRILFDPLAEKVRLN